MLVAMSQHDDLGSARFQQSASVTGRALRQGGSPADRATSDTDTQGSSDAVIKRSFSSPNHRLSMM
jgi:hypothetical protein